MSGFQYENVIFPDNEPVLLVNRDWQIPGRKPKKGGRKRQESQSQVVGGKVHTFRIKTGPAEVSGKVQLESASPTRTRHAPLSEGQASSSSKKRLSQNESIIDFGTQKSSSSTSQNVTPPQQAEEAASHRERGSQGSPSSSDESSHVEDITFEATLVDSDDYSLVPSSRVNYNNAQQTLPGVDACLLQLSMYETPDFIPKAHFLNYYVANVADYMYPLKGLYKLNPLLSVWLPIILVDELWFYCILYTVARHLHASRHHRSYEKECIYLADLLYQKLRRRLESGADGDGLTDVDCAAVACLLGVEHAFGSKEGAAQHARGLASFVGKRGGVERISGVLRTKICRADVEAAIDHSVYPALQPVSYTEPLSQRLALPGPTPQYNDHPAYESLLRYLSLPVAAIAVDFLALTTYLENETASHNLVDPFVLDDSVLSIQHRLARCNLDVLLPLDKAFRAASLVFIKCLIRPLGVVARTSTCKVTQVRENVDLSDDVPQPLLTWLLFMGLIGGPALHEERILISSKLVDEMKKMHADQSFPDWQCLRSKLKEIAWIDAILDGIGEKIWAELDAVALV